jgi:hypothetical protein
MSRSIFLNFRSQRSSRQILEDEKFTAFPFLDSIDRCDVRVIESRDGERFLLEIGKTSVCR